MGYFQVRYDPRVINYNRRGFIRLATESNLDRNKLPSSIAPEPIDVIKTF